MLAASITQNHRLLCLITDPQRFPLGLQSDHTSDMPNLGADHQTFMEQVRHHPPSFFFWKPGSCKHAHKCIHHVWIRPAPKTHSFLERDVSQAMKDYCSTGSHSRKLAISGGGGGPSSRQAKATLAASIIQNHRFPDGPASSLTLYDWFSVGTPI